MPPNYGVTGSGYNNKLETPDDKLGVGGALVVFSRGWPGPTQRAAGRHTTVSQHSPSSASNDQLGSVMTRSVVVRGRGVKDYVDHHLSCSVCPAGCGWRSGGSKPSLTLRVSQHPQHSQTVGRTPRDTTHSEDTRAVPRHTSHSSATGPVL